MGPVLIKTNRYEKRHHDDAATDSQSSSHKPGHQPNQHQLPDICWRGPAHGKSA